MNVELREENGELHAYRKSDNREIPIPSYPKPHVDIQEWLRGLSPWALEAARLYYHELWAWDDDAEKYRLLVELIEAHQRTFAKPVGYKGKTKTDAAMHYAPYMPLKS